MGRANPGRKPSLKNLVRVGDTGVDGSSERGINSLKWITALCQEHCRNTSDYWEDGISAFLYRLAGCQRMLFPVVGGRWLGRIGSVIEIMHFYRSFRAFSSRCCLIEPDVGRYYHGRWLKIGFKVWSREFRNKINHDIFSAVICMYYILNFFFYT